MASRLCVVDCQFAQNRIYGCEDSPMVHFCCTRVGSYYFLLQKQKFFATNPPFLAHLLYLISLIKETRILICFLIYIQKTDCPRIIILQYRASEIMEKVESSCLSQSTKVSSLGQRHDSSPARKLSTSISTILLHSSLE